MHVNIGYANDFLWLMDDGEFLREFLHARGAVIPAVVSPLQLHRPCLGEKSGYCLYPRGTHVRLSMNFPDMLALARAAFEAMPPDAPVDVTFDEGYELSRGHSLSTYEVRPGGGEAAGIERFTLTAAELVSVVGSWVTAAGRKETPVHPELEASAFAAEPARNADPSDENNAAVIETARLLRAFHPEVERWGDYALFNAWVDYSTEVLLVSFGDVYRRDSEFLGFVYVCQTRGGTHWFGGPGHEMIAQAMNALWPPPNLPAGFAVAVDGSIVRAAGEGSPVGFVEQGEVAG